MFKFKKKGISREQDTKNSIVDHDDNSINKSLEEVNNICWQIMETYFKDNPTNLVDHHLESYNHFVTNVISSIFQQINPLKILDIRKGSFHNPSEEKNTCNIYLGGIDGKQIYFGKPILYNDNNNNAQFMYPNIARLKNMTYGVSILYDVVIKYNYNFNPETKKFLENEREIKEILLGKIPIMLQSKLCILNKLNKQVRFGMGECRYDYGGYFIIKGQEKVFISQEELANNSVFITKNKVGEPYSYTAEIKSHNGDFSTPVRNVTVRTVISSDRYTHNQIVVFIPNVSKPIPLFILMRALGIISDKDIIETCLLDIDKRKSFVEQFINSIHAAKEVFTQSLAIHFLSQLTINTTEVLTILSEYFLPHVGKHNLLNKAYFLGYMVFKLLNVSNGFETPTDLNSFQNKRVQTSGHLMAQIFQKHFTIQVAEIIERVQTKYSNTYSYYEGNNYVNLINTDDFSSNTIENGVEFELNQTTEILCRQSWNSTISQLRKIKIASLNDLLNPALLHTSQWGLIDPIDTPEFNKKGLYKQLAISTKITTYEETIPIISWFQKYIIPVLQCTPKYMHVLTKVFINGNWLGSTDNPLSLISLFKLYRRNGIIPTYYSIRFHYRENEISVFTDAGRLTRPLIYVEKNKASIFFNSKSLTSTWQEITTGYLEKPSVYKINSKFYSLSEIYPNLSKPNILKELNSNKSIIEYLDSSETHSAMIANDFQALRLNTLYTHMELEASLLFGIIGNSIIYPEHNQITKNTMACIQCNEAFSLYNSNYLSRFDRLVTVLHYGQAPLIKSKYTEFTNNNDVPNGINAIVAIMSSFSNAENAILVNEASVQRGLLLTTRFTSYESEESDLKEGVSKFSNFKNEFQITKKPGYDYTLLEDSGIIKENTKVNDKTVLIGNIRENNLDNSLICEKGQHGYVDKTFVSEGINGFNIAKIRIREEKQIKMGDTLSSRCGQKGAIGIIIPEVNMPFTSDGLRPDIIISPNSSVPVGQILECLFGKVCASYGATGDGTAFNNIGSNRETLSKMLTEHHFHSSGNQILYDGQCGIQLQANIFIGPTYYMKIKHNDQEINIIKLKFKEEERDAILAHGMTSCVNEGVNEFMMAVCNNTGAIAIYNNLKNQFFSLNADGPIQFTDTVAGNIKNITKFGRSFSLVRVPLEFKQLMLELEVMNIQMRIITTDNVDKLLSLTEFDNVKKLIKLKNTNELTVVVENYIKQREQIVAKRKKIKTDIEDNVNYQNTTNNNLPLIVGTPEEGAKIIRDFLLQYPVLSNKQLPVLLSGFNTEQNENVPQTNGPWNINDNSIINTMKYIFKILFCHCFLLLVTMDGLPKFYELKPSGIPDYYAKLLKQTKKSDEIEKLLAGENLRMNQCVIEPDKVNDIVVNKYAKWISSFTNENNGTSNLPPGVFILNTHNSVLLRKNHLFPWSISRGDDDNTTTEQADYLPILSSSGAVGYLDIPIPSSDVILKTVNTELTTRQQVPWDQKIEKALFRGTTSGCGTTTETNPRIKLAFMMMEPDADEFLDTGITSVSKEIKLDPKIGFGSTNIDIDLKPNVENKSTYKYIIHIDGDVADYSLLETMLTGSVVLKVNGPYLSWIDHLIQDGTHYVGVNADLSNLMEKISWCIENDDTCKKIANEARLFSLKVSQKDYINDSFIKTLWATYQTVTTNLNNPGLTQTTNRIEDTTTNPPNLLESYVMKEKEQPEVWQKQFSESQKKSYWINSKTENIVWDNPEEWQKNISTAQPQWTNEKLSITTTLNPETSDVIYNNAKASAVVIKKKAHEITPILAVEEEKVLTGSDDEPKKGVSEKTRVIKL